MNCLFQLLKELLSKETGASSATGGAGLNMAVTLPLVAEVCCKGTGQQLKPFFHWCVCPLVSMAPVRRLNIGEARAALP